MRNGSYSNAHYLTQMILDCSVKADVGLKVMREAMLDLVEKLSWSICFELPTVVAGRAVSLRLFF